MLTPWGSPRRARPLSELAPRLSPPRPRDHGRHAAVAVVLREQPDLQVLLMRRTEREGDTWSGHVSCPGGFSQPQEDPVTTAARETEEELGLRLGAPLGALPDHPRWPWARLAPVSVTPVVFEVRGDPALTPEPSEVASARWVRWSDLTDTANRERFWWRLGKPNSPRRRGLPLRLSRVRVHDYVVWGLTLAILDALQRRL